MTPGATKAQRLADQAAAVRAEREAQEKAAAERSRVASRAAARGVVPVIVKRIEAAAEEAAAEGRTSVREIFYEYGVWNAGGAVERALRRRGYEATARRDSNVRINGDGYVTNSTEYLVVEVKLPPPSI